MSKGWLCPQCGKAHGPHVDTCPDGGSVFGPPVVIPTVWTIPNQPRHGSRTDDPPPPWPIVTCNTTYRIGGQVSDNLARYGEGWGGH